MFNPPHPGEVIHEIYLDPHGLSVRSIAAHLKVSPSTFSRLVSGQTGVSADMAVRLSKVLGRSPESWLAMQANYDLWHAQQQDAHDDLEEIDFEAIA
jgi:addiction module HigA family antidote